MIPLKLLHVPKTTFPCDNEELNHFSNETRCLLSDARLPIAILPMPTSGHVCY